MKVFFLLLSFFLFIPKTPTDVSPLLYQKSKGYVIKHRNYIVSYDTTIKTTYWVSYELTKEMVENPRYSRGSNFRKDPYAPNSPSPTDYTRSGYDQGHLANSQDMKFNVVAQYESFYMTNVVPQSPSLNRGAWLRLENQSRKWAVERGSIVIITGTIFANKTVKTIGKNKIPVPSHLYKIIYDPKKKDAIAFIMKNDVASDELHVYVVTINAIEKNTGVDFLYALDDKLENRIEARKNYTWLEKK
jgi:endonuclease G, mitochondrial